MDARRLVQLLRWICGPLALLFLLVVAYRARDFIAASLQHIDWPTFLGAAALWSFSHLVAPALAWTLLRADGLPLRYGQAVAIHVGRLPARYLPGGIWHTVSRVVDYSSLGATRAQLSRLLVLENTIPLGVTTLLGGMLFLLHGRHRGIAAAATLAGAAVLVLAPLLLQLLRRRGWTATGSNGYGAAVAATLLFWPIAAGAFCLYWLALPATAVAVPLPAVAATYLLSWAAGFAMIFSPQGAGVFEATFAVMAGSGAAFADSAIVAAGFRIAVLAADLGAFALYLLLRLRKPATAGS